MVSKGQLEIKLSQLKGFERPKVRLEQYIMDSKIGAEVLWNAYMRGDIEGKRVADLGCGTGILGIGALLLGAKEVIFLDIDEIALERAKSNVKKVKSEDKTLGRAIFICSNVKNFDKHVDTVIENPPFGVKKKGNDRVFLDVSANNANVVYHFGKSESHNFIEKYAGELKLKVRNRWDFMYPIKAKYNFHQKRIHRFGASCWRLSKAF
jgi:putative methylase